MRVIVFQRGGLGKHIIEGLKKHSDMDVLSFTVREDLPQIIDKPEEFLDTDFTADLIFDHLYHRDLSEHLVKIAKKKGIPIIVPGAKIEGAITPRICCALVTRDEIPGFEKFGYPEFEVEVEEGRIKDIKVVKGAPCGATWDAAEKVVGMKVDDAIPKIALEVQFLCKASAEHDVTKSKKAPLHLAGDVHAKAVARATRK
jgi:hypothetical protein